MFKTSLNKQGNQKDKFLIWKIMLTNTTLIESQRSFSSKQVKGYQQHQVDHRIGLKGMQDQVQHRNRSSMRRSYQR